MAPKRLTKAESLQFPFATKRLYKNPMAKAHTLPLGLTANPGGDSLASDDYNKDDLTPPLALIESTPSSVSLHVSGTTRQKNGTPPPRARSQANTSTSAVQEQLPDTQSDQPYIPPQRRRGNLPVLLLDIEIGVDQPRGTKRSATIAAHSDKAPNEDLGGDGEPGPRKVATPIERACLPRYSFLCRSQRRRVDDDPKTAEAAATDDLWVAVGEEGCDLCKLVGREVCKPQWDESSKPPCTSCVFCMGKSQSCNPPDSWLEKAGTKLHPKPALPKTHQGISAGNSTPIEVGKIPETATEASPPTTEVEVVKSQSGHDKGGKVAQTSLSNVDRILRIETRLSSIEGQLEGLGAIHRTQQEPRAMLQGLCRHQGFTPSLRSGLSAAAFTRSTVPSPLAYSLGIRNTGHGDKEPSQNIGGPSTVPQSSAQVDVGPSADPPEKAPPKSRPTQGSASANVEEEISGVTRDLDRILATLETLIGQIVIISTKLQAICDDSDLG
ncbi:hypothetical protein EDB92DRAFT_1953514 [Lactarius akahatsu]|uniref:Uncharacterized protein n=1 Tax=Lactarius akahatsu TaxID=416441 RepID=A0AAD4L839_9AGAM|nr:hypothetical protein EDB92DRAFT_1953514 [Lactarius akahatsu]